MTSQILKLTLAFFSSRFSARLKKSEQKFKHLKNKNMKQCFSLFLKGFQLPEINSDLEVDVLLRAVFELFQVSLIEGFERIVPSWMFDNVLNTAQKMKFSIKDFFSKCDQIRRNCGLGHIY